MGILSQIKYDGPGGSSPWLVYKCESEEFVLGSQLIVNQSQEALFIKGGKAVALFGPGTHTLTSGNIPIFGKVVNSIFGGKTPFTAEVYFINKISSLNQKWGLKDPIEIEDPKYGLFLNVRAFGEYSIKITDARLFVTKLLGAIEGNTVIGHTSIKSFINSLVNMKMRELVAKYISEKAISYLEITPYLSELSIICNRSLVETFEANGVEIDTFVIESINVPDSDLQELRDKKKQLADKRIEMEMRLMEVETDRKELDMLGDNYFRKRSFDSLEKLAENEGAGGLAATTMGLGVGLGAAGAAGQAFSSITAPISEATNFGVIENTTAQPESHTIVCKQCAQQNQPNSKFCMGCGEMLTVKRACYSCQSELSSNALFCGQCGANQQEKSCPSCGHKNDIHNKFCNECGTKC